MSKLANGMPFGNELICPFVDWELLLWSVLARPRDVFAFGKVIIPTRGNLLTMSILKTCHPEGSEGTEQTEAKFV
jgi:hypothetical protein